MVFAEMEELAKHMESALAHVQMGGRVIVGSPERVCYALIGGESWARLRRRGPRPFQNGSTSVVLWRSALAFAAGRIGQCCLVTADLEMAGTELAHRVAEAKAHIDHLGGRVVLCVDDGAAVSCALVGRDDWPEVAMFDVAPSLVDVVGRRRAVGYAIRAFAGSAVADGEQVPGLRDSMGFAGEMIGLLSSYAVSRRSRSSHT
jgi:hypothetical protein